MKKILLGLAVFGFASPALAHNGFVYVDRNNDIRVLVTGNENIPQNEDLQATGGKIDPAVKTGTITICDGPGGAIAGILKISTTASGKVHIELVTDPRVVTGVCPKTLPPGDVNDQSCPGHTCIVTPLFPGAKDVEVHVE